MQLFCHRLYLWSGISVSGQGLKKQVQRRIELKRIISTFAAGFSILLWEKFWEWAMPLLIS